MNYGTDNMITAPGPSNSEILMFINLSLENNHTTIQCQATLQSIVTQFASEGVLLLQGIKFDAEEFPCIVPVQDPKGERCLAGPCDGEVTARSRV